MPTGIVHNLELIEIQITHSVFAAPAFSGLRRALQPVFEFAPIHESRKRVVRGMESELLGKCPCFCYILHGRENPPPVVLMGFR